jgi:hypothetical protein
MAPVTEMQALAARILAKFYDGRVDLMAGDRHKDARQVMLDRLTGRKNHKAKCGVTAIEKAFFEVAGIVPENHTCQANAISELQEWAKTFLI